MRPIRSALTLSIVALFTLLAAPSAHAGYPAGIRVGFTSDPDQVVFGGQFQPPPIADRLYIVPAGEVGIGDDAFSLAFMGDLQYRFRTDSSVTPYAGGGLEVYYYDPDNFESDTNLGVNVLGGIFFGKSTPMFVDLKLGLTDDTPDLDIVFGVMWH